MKIICVGRNYAPHARELNNEIPDSPVLFLKPDTALLRKNEAFFIPDFSEEVHFEAEIVLRIGKQGKNIESPFAHRYIEAYTVGIDFTARDLQRQLKEKGLPWEKAKAFDRSAAVGEWHKFNPADVEKGINFSLLKNGSLVQKGNTSDLIFPFGSLIEHASAFFTLKTGDLIFTGTPEGVGSIAAKDYLQGFLGENKVMDLTVR